MSVKHTPPGKWVVFSTPNWLWGGQREEIIAYCVSPWKIHHSSKASIAWLASEYEQIKLALWVWPYGERVCSHSKHHWWVTGRRNKEIWGVGGSGKKKPTSRQEMKNYRMSPFGLGWAFHCKIGTHAKRKIWAPEAPRNRGALVTLRNQRVSSRGL